MKKLTFAALVAATLVVGGVAVNNHYNNYKHNPKPTVTAADEQTLAKVQAAKKAQYESDQKLYNGLIDTLSAECKKGEAAYNQLTAWRKTQVAAPKCQVAQ